MFDNRELSSKKSHPNTQTVNSRCFKLHRSFYNSLDLSNAYDFFPGVEFQRTVSKLTKTKRKSVVRCLVFTSSIKREIRKFHVVVVQRKQPNVQKSVMNVQSCCFALSSYCFFLLSRRRFILNFLLFTIHCNLSETEFSQCKLNCSC